jgi:hypothetical protein
MKTLLIAAGAILLAAAIWGALQVGGNDNDHKANAQQASPTATTPGPAQPTVAPTNSAPYNLPPQPQIGHPSLYLETGVPCVSVGGNLVCNDVDAHTKTYKIEILADAVAIVGGFKVDGVDGGVYKAIAGPGTLQTTVTDGFVAITKKDWGQGEWCFRLSQAVQYKWAHAHETPLSGWTCGGTQPQGSPAATGRQETGIGNTLPFSAGADVIGVDIVLDNGTTYHACRVASAPTGGKVTTGVIGPNADEIAKASTCK